MSRGGVLSKAWERLRSLVLKETFVGADANGNKYYRLVTAHVPRTQQVFLHAASHADMHGIVSAAVHSA
jgi:hypothetical protein